MKRLLCLVLIGIICISIVGCSSKNAMVEETIEEATTKIEESTVTTTEPKLVNLYSDYHDFCDGFAWIEFNNVNGYFLGCINKKGQMIFQLEDNGIEEVTSFSNGYAYIRYGDSLKIINKMGEVTSSYPIDENNNIVAFGDGYVLTENYKASFDSVLYTYNICGYSGDVLESFNFNQKEDYYTFRHFGKGVFGYYTSPWEWKIYFPNSDKWIDFNPGGNRTFYFEDDVALMEIDYGSGFDSRDGFRGKLRIIDLNGNIKNVIIPEDYGWNWVLSEVAMLNGLCSFEEYKEFLISYDQASNNFYKLDDTYAEKVIYDNLPEPLVFRDGYIALMLRGSDELYYVGVFNTKWELVFDLIQIPYGEIYSLTDERLIVTTETKTVVYDMSGEVVFTPTEMGYSQIIPYSDGVARIADESEPTYIDKSGNVLFKEVDMSNCVCVN